MTEDRRPAWPDSLKVSYRDADRLSMVNSVSSANASSSNQVTQPAARQPQASAQAPTGSAVPQDKVTLKSGGDMSTGDPDHDGK